MTKHIVEISFLLKGASIRTRIKPDKHGKFDLPYVTSFAGNLSTKHRPHTAFEVVRHEQIKEADPVLTLANGEKIRVFLSGDSRYLPALAEGIVRAHDDFFLEKKKEENKKKFAERGKSVYRTEQDTQPAHSFEPDDWFLGGYDNDDYT
jgi:hypothetical protein